MGVWLPCTDKNGVKRRIYEADIPCKGRNGRECNVPSVLNELHPLNFWGGVDSAPADLKNIFEVCKNCTFLCGINGSGKVFVPIYS